MDNDSGSQFVNLDMVSASGDASPNTVWHQVKRTPEYNIVHFINLANNDNQWRNSANPPTLHTNIATKVYVSPDETISGVYLASPDHDDNRTQSLAYTTGTDIHGDYVAFTLPSLEYWSMVYMKRSFDAPTDDIYEAELAIKSATAANNNHSGYTGSGFVDQFSSLNDGVSFIVPSDGEDYALRFRYSNGGTAASKRVFVDGRYAGTVHFPSTGGWDQWRYAELTVSLPPGYRSIVLWHGDASYGAINLDHMQLAKTYIWQFDRQIDSVPDGYRITFRAGLPGWVHWGTNGWTGVTDTALAPNGSSAGDLAYEISVGPFATGDTVDFTFLWDDNNNGILEPSVDRWEGTDFEIGID